MPAADSGGLTNRVSVTMREDVEAVLAVNREFYRAFTERDLLAMHELWATECPVACVHPGWDMLVDRGDVMESWKGIFSNPGSPSVACNNEIPYVMGDMAFVLCHEVLDEGTLAATNFFRSFDGVWRMVHHQSTPMGVAPVQDLGPVSGHVH